MTKECEEQLIIDGKTAEINEENDCFDNFEDLAKKKQEKNEFNAEGNTANSQLFIQDIGNGQLTVNYYMQSSTPVALKTVDDKIYDLGNVEDCIKFVEKYNDSECFVTALVICVLQTVPLGDLQQLRSIFLKCLDEEIQLGEEESKKTEQKYVALNTILATVGAKQFIDRKGIRCVGMDENAKSAMGIFFEQYLVLQKVIPSFLVNISEEDKFCTSFYRCQIADALSRLALLNIVDFKSNIVELLYKNSKNADILSILIYKLYSIGQKKEADSIIREWFSLKKTWLWKSIYLTYAILRENEIEFPFEKELKRLISNRIIYLFSSERRFLAGILMQSKAFRTMIATIFATVYDSKNDRDEKIAVAQAYLNLVRNCYYKVNYAFTELPLVACDLQEQQNCLGKLLDIIMAVYDLRKQLYAILKAYLREVSRYELTDKGVNHVSAYFYNLSMAGEEYREDISNFLVDCHCSVAEKINQRLCKTYDKKKEKV